MAVTMPTIRRTAVKMKDELVVGRSIYTPLRVDRNCGNDVVRSLLAVEVSVGIARVWIKPLARRIEYLAHVVDSPAGGTFVGRVA